MYSRRKVQLCRCEMNYFGCVFGIYVFYYRYTRLLYRYMIHSFSGNLFSYQAFIEQG